MLSISNTVEKAKFVLEQVQAYKSTMPQRERHRSRRSDECLFKLSDKVEEGISEFSTAKLRGGGIQELKRLERFHNDFKELISVTEDFGRHQALRLSRCQGSNLRPLMGCAGECLTIIAFWREVVGGLRLSW